MLGGGLKARRGATPAVVELGSVVKKNAAPAPAPAPLPGKKVLAATEEVWEVRPGGMLVQKRTVGGALVDHEPAAAAAAAAAVAVKPVPTIRVKVKHGGVTHEIYISAQASFGELRKAVAERVPGAHPDDQKVLYKDKERDPKAFLDMAGVKDRSRLVVVDDPEARARRLLEERRAAHLYKASKAIAAVTAEVDNLAPKVSAMEAAARKGEKVAEKEVVQVTELLMNELLKLDAVVVADDGDVKAKRRMQVKRVQRYVETLDAVAAKIAAIARKSSGAEKVARKKQEQPPPPAPARQQQSNGRHHHHQQQQQQQQQEQQWEMFDDLLSSLPSTSSGASSTTTVSSTASSGGPPPPPNRLDWML